MNSIHRTTLHSAQYIFINNIIGIFNKKILYLKGKATFKNKQMSHRTNQYSKFFIIINSLKKYRSLHHTKKETNRLNF